MNIRKVSPTEFFQSFHSVVTERNADVQRLWNNAKEYTALMRTNLLPAVANRLGLVPWSSDYYWLDAIFFERRETKHAKPGKTYAQYLSVAIEHENQAEDTFVEMNKLQLYNAPLKVLITYDDGEVGERQMDKLRTMWTDVARSADIFDDFATLRRILAIVGVRGKSTPTWRGFEYNGEAFAEMRR